MELTIFTDGASRGNPGLASYGFLVKDRDGKLLHEEGKYLGTQTNNFAEYSAILAAIKYVKASYEDSAVITLHFLMDSKLAVEQLSGRYRVKNPVIRVFFTEIIGLVKGFKQVSFQHIPRNLNYEADRLANIALDSL